jgi:hypothetical protein
MRHLDYTQVFDKDPSIIRGRWEGGGIYPKTRYKEKRFQVSLILICVILVKTREEGLKKNKGKKFLIFFYFFFFCSTFKEEKLP